MELERDARAMIRKGEMNPFELPTLATANADDYAVAVIALLRTMKPDDPRRTQGLLQIKRWIDHALAGGAGDSAEEIPAEVSASSSAP